MVAGPQPGCSSEVLKELMASSGRAASACKVFSAVGGPLLRPPSRELPGTEPAAWLGMTGDATFWLSSASAPWEVRMALLRRAVSVANAVSASEKAPAQELRGVASWE